MAKVATEEREGGSWTINRPNVTHIMASQQSQLDAKGVGKCSPWLRAVSQQLSSLQKGRKNVWCQLIISIMLVMCYCRKEHGVPSPVLFTTYRTAFQVLFFCLPFFSFFQNIFCSAGLLVMNSFSSCVLFISDSLWGIEFQLDRFFFFL